MKVKNFKNLNQFIIENEGKKYLQSYQSLVVEIGEDKEGIQTIKLGIDWDYSRTTLKHVYLFLQEYSKIEGLETQTNKKDYIKKLITSYCKDMEGFKRQHNYRISYDEKMI